MLSSCERDLDLSSPQEQLPVDTINIADTLTGLAHEESGDYTWDEQSLIYITLNGNSITASSPLVNISGSTATIKGKGNYKISGTLNNGRIIVDAKDEDLVRLILNNASIHYPSGPALFIDDAKKVVIALPEGTKNVLTDGQSYADPDDDPNAALFSKTNLTIFGSGELSVTGNYKDGITGKDGLLLKSGNYVVKAVDDAVRGKDYLIARDGNYNLESGGDAMKSDDESGTGTGEVVIFDGTYLIRSGGDGISAKNRAIIDGGRFDIVCGGGYEADTNSVSQKGIKADELVRLKADSLTIDATDHAIDSDNSIEIISGSYTIYTARAGFHSNNSTIVIDGDINIIRSMEGFESHNIIMNGGSMHIISIDDGFSATAGYDVDVDDQSLIRINDGLLVVDCIRGDGIDSNGSIELNGGKVVIHGPLEAPEVAVDHNNTFKIAGGFIAASGTNSELMEYPDSTSTQNSIVAIFSNSYPEETIFNITDDAGTSVVSFKPSGDYQSVIFSSAALVTGKSYYLNIGGTSDGEFIDGVSEGGTYNSGSRMASFTITQPVTILRNLKSTEDDE